MGLFEHSMVVLFGTLEGYYYVGAIWWYSWHYATYYYGSALGGIVKKCYCIGYFYFAV